MIYNVKTLPLKLLPDKDYCQTNDFEIYNSWRFTCSLCKIKGWECKKAVYHKWEKWKCIAVLFKIKLKCYI